MVSLGHDIGPASLSHKGSLSQLAQLPFSWGGALFLHSAPLAIFQGIPRVGQHPVKIIQHQREPQRQALESLETSENRPRVPGLSLQ